jgi:hypothetical protein
VVTEKDIQELARQLLEQAKIGDLAAVKILFAYAIGRPTDAVDPDSLDVKEWQHFRQSPVGIAEMEAVFAGMPPDMASAIVGAAWPGMARQVARWMAERLKEDPNAVSLSRAKSGRK